MSTQQNTHLIKDYFIDTFNRIRVVNVNSFLFPIFINYSNNEDHWNLDKFKPEQSLILDCNILPGKLLFN